MANAEQLLHLARRERVVMLAVAERRLLQADVRRLKRGAAEAAHQPLAQFGDARRATTDLVEETKERRGVCTRSP